MYSDPNNYDRESPPFDPEGTILLEIAQNAGPVLELGCGTGTDHYDHLKQIWLQTLFYRTQNNGEEVSIERKELALRYIMPQEMEALLHYNGFVVRSRYSDWKGSPLSVGTFQHIYVCEIRR